MNTFIRAYLIAPIFLLLSALACGRTATLQEVHGFSNLVLDGGQLWVGAGYKLYRVDLAQGTATLVFDTGDVVISDLVLDDQQLYFGGHRSPTASGSVIWAMDEARETVSWKQELGNHFWGGRLVVPLLVSEHELIVGTRTTLFGLDKTGGQLKWTIDGHLFGTGEWLTPILADGQLVYGMEGEAGSGMDRGSGQQIVFADPATGSTLRTLAVPGTLGAVPALYDGRLYVKDYQNYEYGENGESHWIGALRLNCVDMVTGQIVWTFDGHGVPAQSNLAFDQGLVLDVFANELYAIDAQSGVARWVSPALDVAGRNPHVIADLGLIAVDLPAADRVIFVDAADGRLRSESLEGVLTTPLFLGQEAIYATPNTLIRVDVGTGKVMWSTPVDSHYQVFADDD